MKKNPWSKNMTLLKYCMFFNGIFNCHVDIVCYWFDSGINIWNMNNNSILTVKFFSGTAKPKEKN